MLLRGMVRMAGSRGLLLVGLCWLALLGGCRGDRSALQRYLTTEHPGLTEGSAEVVQAFDAILRRGGPQADVLAALDREVLEPYVAIVARLEAFEPDADPVKRHHAAYLLAAQRQLQAFQAARGAVSDGTSLDEVGGMLKVNRQEMERWLAAVRADAKALGIALVEPQT